MPQFNKSATTKLYLPSTESEINEEAKAWVEVKTKLSMGDLLALNDCKDDTERGIALLVRIVKDWNNTDEAGNKKAIDDTIAEELAPEDFVFISQWINDNITESMKGLGNDEKKASSSVLTPEAATPPPTI